MPEAPPALKLFGDYTRVLAQAVMRLIHQTVSVPWKEAYLDLRSTPDGTSRAAKLRVIPVSGALITVPIPDVIADVIQDIWKMNAFFSPPWYGMKMNITSEGQVQIDFSYDPSCVSEPAFLAN